MDLRLPAAAAAVTLLLTACSSGPAEPNDPGTPTGPTSLASPAETTTARATRDAEELVRDPATLLQAVRVERSGTSTTVTALWLLPRPGRKGAYLLSSSDDGFASGSYRRVSQEDGLAAVAPRPEGAPEPGSCATSVSAVLCTGRRTDVRVTRDDGRTWSDTDTGLAGLLVSPVASLDTGVLAAVGGGDGATLVPFEKAARSTDGGATFTTYDLPRFDGARAYTSGQVVLGDGRLAALLDAFSDDRGFDFPADRPHVLWASAGDDWTSFEPLTPEFTPTLPVGEDRPLVALGATVGPDPVVWATTSGQRLYVSDDGAATFTEVAAR